MIAIPFPFATVLLSASQSAVSSILSPNHYLYYLHPTEFPYLDQSKNSQKFHLLNNFRLYTAMTQLNEINLNKIAALEGQMASITALFASSSYAFLWWATKTTIFHFSGTNLQRNLFQISLFIRYLLQCLFVDFVCRTALNDIYTEYRKHKQQHKTPPPAVIQHYSHVLPSGLTLVGVVIVCGFFVKALKWNIIF